MTISCPSSCSRYSFSASRYFVVGIVISPSLASMLRLERSRNRGRQHSGAVATVAETGLMSEEFAVCSMCRLPGHELKCYDPALAVGGSRKGLSCTSPSFGCLLPELSQ
jgi:hypothetical protein